MTRRYLLISGLVLLIFALIGVGMLAARQTVTAHQTATITIGPGSCSDPSCLAVSYDPGSVTETASSPAVPVGIGALFILVVLAAGTFVAARQPVLTPEERWARTRNTLLILLILASPVIVCVLGICGVTFYLFFGNQILHPDSGPSASELTNVYMQTQIANTQVAAGSPPPTPTLSPNEMTNAFMQTAISRTATTVALLPTPTPEPPSREPVTYTAEITWPLRIEQTDTGIVTLRLVLPDERTQFVKRTPYGDRFNGVIRADLTGNDFEIVPAAGQLGGPVRNVIGSPNMYWQWRVRPPPESGRRSLSLVIGSDWERLGPEWQSPHIERVMAQPELDVTVLDFPIPSNRLTLPILIGALLGGMLCVPWLYGVFKRHPPA